MRHSTATSSPLYRAALEEMAGGLGHGGKKHKVQEAGYVLIKARKVPKSDISSGSLYRVMQSWVNDSGVALEEPEQQIDVFGLPKLPATFGSNHFAKEDATSKKRGAVEKLLSSSSSGKQQKKEDLLDELKKRAKREREETVEDMRKQESLCEERLAHLDRKTKNVRL